MRHLDVSDAAAVPPVTPSPSSKKYAAKKNVTLPALTLNDFTDARVSNTAIRLRVHIHENSVLATLFNIHPPSMIWHPDSTPGDFVYLRGPNTSPQLGLPDVSPATHR